MTWGIMLAGVAVAAGVLVAGVPATSQAQTMYRCKAPNGSALLSDRPCPGDPLPSTTPSDRALPTPPYDPYRRRLGADEYRLPEYYTHLSAGCRQLHDAIRTAPARGLRSDTIYDLRKEWAQKCSEDERIAYRRLREERRVALDERVREERAEQTQLDMEARRREQCGEMRMSLTQRRARIDAMTPGERADLERFEKNYTMRCM